MEPSRNDFVGKTQRFETLGIDPLVGKNLWDNVAVSSPCIGQYKLTCLQNASVFSLFRLRALSSPLSTLVVLAGRFRWETAWCVTAFVVLLRGLCWVTPSWASLHFSLVAVITPLLHSSVVLFLCGLLLHCSLWLFCVAPSWAVLHCPSWLFCEALSWLR